VSDFRIRFAAPRRCAALRSISLMLKDFRFGGVPAECGHIRSPELDPTFARNRTPKALMK